MKKFLHALASFFSITIGILIAFIFAIGYLLYVPFDIIRYRRMPYYRELKKKYRLFRTSSDVVKFYNRAAKEQIPFQYFENENVEYFVKDNEVLLCGWNFDEFALVENEWMLLLNGECNTTIRMSEVLENEKELLLPEHQNMDAKFMIFCSDITDADNFVQAKACPYFRCMFSPDEP